MAPGPTARTAATSDLLILFGGGTVGLFVLISLFALLTARNNYVPPAPGNEIHVRTDTTPTQHH